MIPSPTWATVRECGLMLILLHLSYVDCKQKKIPNTDLVLAVILRGILPQGEMHGSVSESVLYGLLLAAGMYILAGVYRHVRSRKGLGGGDIKLTFVLCLYLQGEQSLWMLLTACLFTLLFYQNDRFAFGPYLCIGWAVARLLF